MAGMRDRAHSCSCLVLVLVLEEAASYLKESSLGQFFQIADRHCGAGVFLPSSAGQPFRVEVLE